MPKIVVGNQIENKEYLVEGQINLLDWMIENLPSDMDGLHTSIVLNGKELCNTWDYESEKSNELLNIDVGLFDEIVINVRPAGDPITTFIIITLASAAIAYALVPKPSIPTAANVDSGNSSNNQLNKASNSYRPNEAVPDIAGSPVCYPDFVQPSYWTYESNLRTFREIFSLGVGRYDFDPANILVGDTPITELDDYTVNVYENGATVPDTLIVRGVEQSQDVDLVAPDVTTSTVYLSANKGNRITGTYTLIMPLSAITQLDLTVGDVLEIEIDGEAISGGSPVFLAGSFTVASFTTSSITFVEPLSATETWYVAGQITNNSWSYSAPWYTLSGDAIEEVWFNIKMPTGIRKADGTSGTVDISMDVELLSAGVPTGTVTTIAGSFVGSTQSPQFRTFKAIGLTPGSYRARASRLTNSLGTDALDIVTIEVISSVTPYANNFGDVTIIDLTRSSSQRINQGGSSKINLKPTRKLRIYDNSTNIYGTTYEPTSRFCDYVFYQLHEVMGVPIDYIDTDSLFEIHDNLSDSQLGEFHFTFDDKNTSSRERIEVACNAARVRYYNDGLYWRFVREEARAVKSLSFNRRNLKPEAARYTQQFYKNNDYDGVTVVYVDPVTNSEARIHRKISSDAIVSGESVYPLVIELGGCRNTLQATNRLELEVRRLIYQRVKVTDQAMNDALLARLGDRVDWVDMFDSEIFSGEILGISGNDYTTSERFVPQPATTYYVYVTDDEGQPSNSVVATARADGNVFGFTATGLTGAYIKSGQIQLGSRYVIASNSDLNASAFVFNRRGRPDELGNCQIEMVEYNELMFEAD